MQDLNSYQKFAKNIALEAGKIIKSEFKLFIDSEIKADGTPVTIVDKKVNKLIIEKVNANFPTHSILGEEESSESTSNEYLWVCDPIDGTIPFSNGLNTSVFSLALVKEGNPLLGVIYDPFQNLLYSATKDEGSTLNNSRIKVNKIKSLDRKLVVVDGDFKLSEIIKGLEDKQAYFVSYGSFIFGAKMVASGHFSAAIFTAPKPWDCASLKVIIEEAGGKCTDLNGDDQRYDQDVNGFVGTNGLIHDQILEIIKTAND